MPQGRRKKPFSVKQKKKQLQQKRASKIDPLESNLQNSARNEHPIEQDVLLSVSGEIPSAVRNIGIPVITRLNQQPLSGKTSGSYNPNRFKLHFRKESKEEIEARKTFARQPHKSVPETDLEASVDEIYRPGSELDIPKRPPWDFSMSKQKLETLEEKYFVKYIEGIFSRYNPNDISYFEFNLETWRQLWRVLEMSDVVLLITDIRHPVLHFSPALFDYVTKDLKREIILILNKVDLVSPGLTIAWTEYFKERFPGLYVIPFTAFPKDKEQRLESHSSGKVRTRKHKRKQYPAVGPRQLMFACDKIVGKDVNLTSWREKIDADALAFNRELINEAKMNHLSVKTFQEERSSIATSDSEFDPIMPERTSSDEDDDNDDGDERRKRRGRCYDDDVESDTIEALAHVDTTPDKEKFIKYRNGFPNVGKSSIINGLVGKKVVSTSRTPGHTKYFQTIFLTPTVRLCDCPGLVFPSLVEKPLQILSGIYPIAQVREPYTAVRFLAERLPLPTLLRIQHPIIHENEEKDKEMVESEFQWSAFDICDGWAYKRHFHVARSGLPDSYRAANNILRLALDGRIVLAFRPPGFTGRRDYWDHHPDSITLSKLQDFHVATVESGDSSTVYEKSIFEHYPQSSISSNQQQSSSSNTSHYAIDSLLNRMNLHGSEIESVVIDENVLVSLQDDAICDNCDDVDNGVNRYDQRIVNDDHTKDDTNNIDNASTKIISTSKNPFDLLSEDNIE